jgi:3'-phosphoadenosine 5'-phosphosulfate (PAPS) 3'-phosphatase
MTEITNDNEFRQMLDGFELVQQREVGARFIRSVSDLADDERIEFALKVAGDVEANEPEVASAFKSAKGAVLDCYTRCGADADWAMQAGYFVARAASAVVTPEKDLDNGNPAWQAALHCRMARTCAVIDGDATSEQHETEQQYRILEEFLNGN